MKNIWLINKISESFTDKREKNKHIPINIVIVLAITAKMKLKTSLTDIAFSANDSELLSELGWNIWDTDRNLESGLFSEGLMRNIIEKYQNSELLDSYNNYV